MIAPLARTERNLVATLVLFPERVADAVGRVTPADFGGRDLATLFARMAAAAEAGLPVTAATVAAEDTALGRLWAALLEEGPDVPESVPELARRVAARARRRRVLSALEGAARDLVDAEDEALDATLDGGLARVVAAADGARAQAVHAGGAVLADAMRRAADPDSRNANVTPTGLADVDWLLGGGLRPGRVLVVGARPGVGKSALALCVARNIARAGGVVAFASLEMSADELGDRLLALESAADLRALQAGEIRADALPRVASAYAHAKPWEDRLIILDRVQTVAGMAAALRRLEVKRTPARVLVVDYLQLCRGSKRLDRRLEVGEVSTDLKRLARARGVAVVALSQLARKADERPGAPVLADLYESGQVEADADNVLMLWQDRARPGVLCADMAKNRSGPRGRTDFAWTPACCAVRDLSPVEELQTRGAKR